MPQARAMVIECGPTQTGAAPRLLLPGWPQWAWGQRERSAVLLGSYVSSLALGIVLWGTAPGAGLLVFALFTHAVSAADALRQSAFPPLAPHVPAVGAGCGVIMAYAPAIALAWVLAWPLNPAGKAPAGPGYLVNRWAYREAEPEVGQWLCIDGAAGPGSDLAVLLARSGQLVPSLVLGPQASLFRAGGVEPGAGASESARPLVVPPGHFLVAPPSHLGGEGTGSPACRLVKANTVRGRVWAQCWPAWDRRILVASPADRLIPGT